MSFVCSLALNAALAAGVDEPLRTGQVSPADAGLVVGLEDYAFVARVPYATRDAQAFHDFLLYTRGLPQQKLGLVTGGSHEHIMSEARRLISLVEPGGTFWFYFAGHGAASHIDGKRLLLADDVRQDASLFEERAVSVQALLDLAARQGVRAALVLDTCYGGLGRGGQDLTGGQRLLAPVSARIDSGQSFVWTASAGNELSAPYEPARHGAFTYFALGALRGWADGELSGQRDGVVDQQEAEAYVQRALRTIGLKQTAQAIGTLPPGPPVGQQGEVGPSLLAAPSVGRQAAPLSGGSQVQLQMLRQRQAEREARVLSSSQDLKDKAAADWEVAAQVAAGGGPEAELAVRTYLDAYAAAHVKVDEVDHPVAIAQLAEARQALIRVQSQAVGSGRGSARDGELVPVRTGSFLAGSPPAETGRSTTEVQVKVQLTRAFAIGAIEVTQGFYEELTGENPSDCSVGCGADLPVQNVSWLDAINFCNLLSQREGLNPAYQVKGERVSWDPAANGYRLPTDAEWEYAARAGSTGAYGTAGEAAQVCGSSNVANSAHANRESWVKHDRFPCDDGFEFLAPTATFEANPWGLYDMVGNVSEWTFDTFMDDPLEGGVDPVNQRGKLRSVRGGSWNSLPNLTRVAARFGIAPESASFERGFRLARNVE